MSWADAAEWLYTLASPLELEHYEHLRDDEPRPETCMHCADDEAALAALEDGGG